MPLPRQEVDATTPKYLRDKYAIVGVGETTYTRGSDKTTRALGTWAVRNAILDAGLQGLRHRRHARLFRRRLDQRHVHRRRSRHAPQFLHGCGRRRLVDRGAGRHRDRPHRGRLLQDRRDLPLDERVFAGAHRRHRGALGGAGRRRHAAQPRLWLAERRAELRADLYAPHVRLRHDPGAGRACQDVPQQPRLEQPEGLLQEALHGRGRHQQPLHLQAAAPPRLLRRDRQRHLRHRHHAPSGRRTASTRWC